jgi:hypothetical protein
MAALLEVRNQRPEGLVGVHRQHAAVGALIFTQFKLQQIDSRILLPVVPPVSS